MARVFLRKALICSEGRSSSVLFLLQLVLMASALLLATIGYATREPYIMLFGVFALFLFSIVYICQDIRTRILLAFLYFGIFLFWLTRPLIALFYQTETWLGSTEDTTFFALSAVFLTMLFLMVGSMLYTFFSSASLGEKSPMRFMAKSIFPPRASRGSSGSARINAALLSPTCFSWKRALRASSLILLSVFIGASFLLGVQMLSFMQGASYEEYFITSTSEYSSGLVTSLAGLAPCAMCAYLATLPQRRPATVVLVINILTTLPKLIIGTRTDFVMAVLFMALYYLLRNGLDGKGTWIGRREVTLVVVAVPLGILFLGALNYIRAGGTVGPEGVFMQIGDALYKQGVTFKVLEYGYDVQPSIDELGFKFYSLGSLIHTITQGFVGQLYLGSPTLPDVNSAELALKGPFYSHAMSYYAHPNYLGGEGYGSSYVLELFADFGYGGIIVGSVLLGYTFCAVAPHIGSTWFATTLLLMAARRVFHMPRGEMIECLSFLWSTRFWAALVLLVALAVVLRYLAERRDGVRVSSRGSRSSYPMRLRLRRLPEFESGCLRSFPVVSCLHPLWRTNSIRLQGSNEMRESVNDD